MLRDRVSNPGPLLTSQVPYRLRYAARRQNYEDASEGLSVKLHQLTRNCEWTPTLFLDLRMKDNNEEFGLQLMQIFAETLDRSRAVELQDEPITHFFLGIF